MLTTDSNPETIQPSATQSPLGETPTVVPPTIPPTGQQDLEKKAPQKAKTFTERFMEMESDIQLLITSWYRLDLEQKATVESTLGVLDEVGRLAEKFDAFLDVAEEKNLFSRADVLKKINDNRVNAVKKMLEKYETDGIIKKIDQVMSDENVVSLTNKEVPFAFNAIKDIEDEKLKVGLVGAKRGDVVEGFEVLDIFELVTPATPNPQEGENGQKEEQPKN